MPSFVPATSHGFPEFISGCDAVVMGRTTFLPALGAPRWPWPGLQVYVLTSRPLPAHAPAGVISCSAAPAVVDLLTAFWANPGAVVTRQRADATASAPHRAAT
jgi:dihydrofolate reductase